ncbi:MAG TPA: hypothetical protein GXZ27_10175 [Thermoanaerobacterales bacterium]|jgi:glutamate synthase (NADPH/NADH) small chain|nr:hypothetical protein [Thermoanaerobacterales bacterium]
MVKDLHKFNIIIPGELEKKLEDEGILPRHIRQVIENAEKTGNKVRIDGENIFIAHLPIGMVTFWVEYTPDESNFVLLNAYCHRIQIMEGN